jgi:hypothetical protein
MKESWLFPAVQSIHLAGIAALAGTIVLSDLRTLGLLGTPRSGSPSDGLAWWRAAGLIIMALTGPLLFLSDVSRYVNNPAFLVKMAILFIAILAYPILHRRPTRLRALLSIAVWSAVVVAGRAIADFDV